jgi:hypothetical protein
MTIEQIEARLAEISKLIETASTEEIETVWSIPSAFRAYTDIALGRD